MPSTSRRADQFLVKADPKLGHVVRRVKLPPLRDRENHFHALVDAIVSQQLSGKAATTIFNRFMALFPRRRFLSPRAVSAMPLRRMRTAGLSRMKASFIKDLAKKTLDDTLNFKTIHQLSDEDVIKHLVVVKGIGRWTAEMFLIFSLGRPDVFSPGDLGLQNAIMKLYDVRRRPSPKALERMAERWSPYRSTACRYLWRSLDHE